MPGRSHKRFAHFATFGRADRDVLQIGVVAGQASRHRHSLRIVGVYPAGLRHRQLCQFVGVSAFEFGQRAVFQNFLGQGVIVSQLLQHFFVRAARAGRGFFDDGQTQHIKKYLAQLLW